jgi:hypothetical protein
MKRVAAEMKVPLIDLQAESIAYLDGIGEAEGVKLGITKKDAQGKIQPDKTHLNWQGSFVFGRMVAVAMGNAMPELKQYVKPTPAPLPGEGVLAMKVINGASFKIVLVGDSTVATQGGWGPGFCATTIATTRSRTWRVMQMQTPTIQRTCVTTLPMCEGSVRFRFW